jgi:predicted MFS family arabinose efflux permease
MVPAAYRELLAIRRARLPVVASLIGRLPLASEGLAILFLARAVTGSFADAGLVEAFALVGVGVGVPIQGRLVDRLGQPRVLLPAATINAASLGVLVIVARGDPSVAMLAGLSALSGLTIPPISSCMRGLWAAMLDDAQALQSAYALDAVIIEVAFISGPLLAAGLTAAVSPSAAVLAGAILTLVGTVAFAASAASRDWRPLVGPRHWAGALRSRGIWVLIAASAGFGFSSGALVLALTAFGGRHGSPEIVGPFLSIQAVASMIGGIWYGARRWRSPTEEQYPRFNLVLALGLAPLILVPSVAVMGGLMLLAGLAIAPATAIEYLLVDRIAPPGTSTEAFGWVITAAVLGSGIGAALTGSIVNAGDVRVGFVVAFAGAGFAWIASVLGRPVLRLAPEPA